MADWGRIIIILVIGFIGIVYLLPALSGALEGMGEGGSIAGGALPTGGDTVIKEAKPDVIEVLLPSQATATYGTAIGDGEEFLRIYGTEFGTAYTTKFGTAVETSKGFYLGSPEKIVYEKPPVKFENVVSVLMTGRLSEQGGTATSPKPRTGGGSSKTYSIRESEHGKETSQTMTSPSRGVGNLPAGDRTESGTGTQPSKGFGGGGGGVR